MTDTIKDISFSSRRDLNLGKVKYKFKEGEEVAHIEFLTNKMYIERLIKSSRQIEDGHEGKRIINYIQGIRCHWWNEGKLQTAMFHSKEIIPYSVAEDGFIAVQKWIEQNR